MRIGIIGGTLILLATFIMPALVETMLTSADGAAQVADVRGGDTSVGRQLRHIFSQPFSYGIGLLQVMYGTFVEYTVGAGAMGEVGHGFRNSASWAPAIMLTAVTLTESGIIKIKKKHKIYIAIILFVISILIWTALYLSFTPVGYPYVVGVQGRYFIPLVLIGLITLTSFYFSFVTNNM
jgi:uncharacterized membrane protein